MWIRVGDDEVKPGAQEDGFRASEDARIPSRGINSQMVVLAKVPLMPVLGLSPN
jgi:hypothetical protein